MLHDSKSDLSQKLLNRYDFPGMFLFGNIPETKNARAWKKYSSRRSFKGQSIDISLSR